MKLKTLHLAAVSALGLVTSVSAEMKLPKTTSKLSQSIRYSDHMEPFVARPDQQQKAADKLEALEAKTGKKPNILWLIVDDMGFGDPGCYGGGAAIGAASFGGRVCGRPLRAVGMSRHQC